MPDSTLESALNVPPSTDPQPVICGHCGSTFPASSIAMLGLFPVCIQCKPVVEQKLRENLIHPELFWNTLPYADIGSRAMAKFFDWLFLYALIIPVNLTTIFLVGSGNDWVGFGINTGLNTIISVTYYVWTIAKYAATPGKKIMNLEIVTPNSGRVSAWRAFGRFWAEMLSSTLFSIGYFIAIGDEERRTLHDRLCGTRVIQKQALKRHSP